MKRRGFKHKEVSSRAGHMTQEKGGLGVLKLIVKNDALLMKKLH
jgi:hypothetical protein